MFLVLESGVETTLGGFPRVSSLGSAIESVASDAGGSGTAFSSGGGMMCSTLNKIPALQTRGGDRDGQSYG